MMFRSVFYYGHTVGPTNRYFDFFDTETRVAVLRIGDYSLSDFCTEISRAMNEASSTRTYSASENRTNRIIKIVASGVFNLLVTNGDNVGRSAFPLMGFTANQSSLSTYDGNLGSGFEYLPQFPLQSFMGFDKISRPSQSSINESANGNVEVVRFGATNFMECNIVYATNLLKTALSPIENDPMGVENTLAFLNYITQKKRIEFMKDRNFRSDFTRCLLESSSGSPDGTGFRLQELYARGLAHHFETGKLEFRKV